MIRLWRPNSFAAVPHLLFLTGCALCWRFTIDDAYIYLRVLHGPPLEGNGVASYLWVMLGLAGPIGLKVAGVVSGLLLLRWVQQEAGDAAAALVAVYPGAWLHAVAGLETMLAAALLAGVYRYRERAGLSALLAVLAGMTRLEVGATALLLVSLRHWRGAILGAAVLATYAVSVWASVGPYAPAVCKLTQGHFGVGTVAKASLILACVLAIPLWRRTGDVLRRADWIVVAVFLAGISLPRHLGDFAYRFVFPIVPVVLMIAAPALRSASRWRVASAFLVALVLALPWVGYARTMVAVDERLAEIGRTLRSEGVTSLAMSDVGRVPYESGAQTMDVLGLTGTGRPRSAAEVLAFRPDRAILYATYTSPSTVADPPVLSVLRRAGWREVRRWDLPGERYLVEVAQ